MSLLLLIYTPCPDSWVWNLYLLCTNICSIKKLHNSRNQNKVQSLCKSLGDSVHAHTNNNIGLRVCKHTTPPMMPLTARWEISLAVKGAIIICFYLRYSFAAISLITGRPWLTIHNFVACATDCQFFETNPHSGRPCILTWQQQRSIIRVFKNDSHNTHAKLQDMYAPHVSLLTIDRYLL